ncbi:MAG TPA: polysaccharide deacetylase family protein [Nocardioidaceae bacterium]|nr:polysaccharide deacetylase family protein [Nocardioidaceae bacterium]
MTASESQLLVLGWHNVVPSWRFTGSRELFLRGFASQIALLHRAAHVVPLEDALTRLGRGEPLPARSVALTFDDGYADVADIIAPMLLRRRLPATFFLCPGFLERSALPPWEVVSWAVCSAQAQSLDWAGQHFSLDSGRTRRQVARRISADLKATDRVHRDAAVAKVVDDCRPAGSIGLDRLLLGPAGGSRLAELGFAIGSHTVNHPILSREAEADQREEIAGSRDALGRMLGVDPTVFAYPNGERRDFTLRTMEAVADAGYRFAVTTVTGRNDPTVPHHAIRRVMVDPRHGPAAFLHLLRRPGRNGAARDHAVPSLNHDPGC